MTWARLDDRFYSHRKVMRAWTQSRASIGLHVLALTYACGFERDGIIDTQFVELMLPRSGERDRATQALVEAELWESHPEGWRIHDFLDYNPSAEELQAKREKEAARKAAARAGTTNGSPR